jgi:hypothetical protein
MKRHLETSLQIADKYIADTTPENILKEIRKAAPFKDTYDMTVEQYLYYLNSFYKGDKNNGYCL